MKHLFIFGTRPEAIKMAPLIKAFQLNPNFQMKICVTGQHREMLDQVLDFFEIRPDYDLNLMSPDQTLYDITARALLGLKGILSDFRPDNLFVQGDTTSIPFFKYYSYPERCLHGPESVIPFILDGL